MTRLNGQTVVGGCDVSSGECMAERGGDRAVTLDETVGSRRAAPVALE